MVLKCIKISIIFRSKWGKIYCSFGDLIMNKTISIFLIFLLAAFLVYGLTKQINESLKVGARLETAAEEVNKLQETNRNLREELTDVQKKDYVEKVARDKLNLSKPGETVVLITDQTLNQVIESQRPKYAIPQPPNWQRWLRLFI